jgi:hypothetical protein
MQFMILELGSKICCKDRMSYEAVAGQRQGRRIDGGWIGMEQGMKFIGTSLLALYYSMINNICDRYVLLEIGGETEG